MQSPTTVLNLFNSDQTISKLISELTPQLLLDQIFLRSFCDYKLVKLDPNANWELHVQVIANNRNNVQILTYQGPKLSTNHNTEQILTQHNPLCYLDGYVVMPRQAAHECVRLGHSSQDKKLFLETMPGVINTDVNHMNLKWKPMFLFARL